MKYVARQGAFLKLIAGSTKPGVNVCVLVQIDL